MALLLGLAPRAAAGDPQYFQYIESPYRLSLRAQAIDPRTTGVLSNTIGFLGTLGRIPFQKYERTKLTFLMQGSHPIEIGKSTPHGVTEDQDRLTEPVPHQREVYAGNAGVRFGDYHMVDFGPVYSLTGNRYAATGFLSYVQERLFNEYVPEERGTADLDVDGRSYTELGHILDSVNDPTRAGLRLSMKTQYNDGDEFQLVLEDDFDEFRWLVTAELFYFREILRSWQKPQDMLDPVPYPLEWPPVLSLHARLQQHVARSGYDARAKGLQAVVTAIWSPETMEFRPNKSLNVFPQLEEELRCGIVGGELDGQCTLKTAPGYKFVAIRLRSPFVVLGFSKYFEGVHGEVTVRIKDEISVDVGEGSFEHSIGPDVQAALRFY